MIRVSITAGQALYFADGTPVRSPSFKVQNVKTGKWRRYAERDGKESPVYTAGEIERRDRNWAGKGRTSSRRLEREYA